LALNVGNGSEADLNRIAVVVVRLRDREADEAIAEDGKARQQEAMKLHGTIADNLQAALASAKRLRGHPVHNDTLTFWRNLVAKAHSEMPQQARAAEVETLIATLEGELAARRGT
jgi:hypothetical protein